MVRSSRQVHTTPPNGQTTFGSALRFELMDEEQRALLGSYAVASALGVAFLLLVQFGPRAVFIPIELDPDRPIVVGDPNPFRERTTAPVRNVRDGVGQRPASSSASGAISTAFQSGASAAPADAGNIFGGVAVTRAVGAVAGSGGKTVLAHGSDGAGSTTPGRGGIPGTAGGGDIGGVTRGGNVARAAERVDAPAVIAVDPLPPLGDASTLGTYVRGHESQLRFCYQENGLAANPNLAGSITVAVTVAASGSVSAATVTKRSWSGPGAAESESCILRAVRGWRLPASGRAQSTYSFPFNFSR